MIFKSNHPLSPSVDITIGDVFVDYTRIVQVEMELGEFQHDLVRIVMAGIPPMAVTDYINAPVSLTWFQDAMGHDFKGYIVFVDPSYENRQGLVNNSPFQLTTLYCLGASFDMKAKVTRAWEAPTLMSIVKELAEKYQYSYSVPNDSFQYLRLVQSEESDWEFLVRVCHDMGYSVTLHGTHLHVFDRYKALGRQVSAHRLETANVSNDLRLRPGRILTFTGSFGNVTLNANSNDERVTSLNSSGVMITAHTESRESGLGRSLESRFTDHLALNLVSSNYAEAYLEARTRWKFPFEATIELTGTAGIKPGGIVDIQRFNSNFDGVWYVSKVMHSLTFDQFYTEITVLRDSTSDDPFSIAAVPSIPELPASTIRNGFWCAESMLEEIYA